MLAIKVIQFGISLKRNYLGKNQKNNV